MPTIYLISYVLVAMVLLTCVNAFMLKPKKEVQVVEEVSEKEVKIGLLLFVLLFGMFIAILNQTVINVALPVMMTDLNVSATTAQWLVTGFMLVNGILIPISAFLLNKFGFRKLFLTAMIFFAMGSLLCGLVHSFTLMMVGRIVQAIGAGILMPLGMNIFMTVFPPEKRGAAMGTMGIAMILAPAIGPTLAGWIIERYEWNVMFLGMFLIGLLDVFLAYKWFHVKETKKPAYFDLQGIIYSTIGFGGVLYGFSEAGSKTWTDPIVLITLIVGIIFIVLFSIRQLRAEHPLLELRVLKYNMFSFTLLINAINTMALFGGMLLLPIYLQSIRGFTPLESGLLLLPGALLMGVMGPIAGKLFDKYGIRVLAIIGLTITTFATYEFTKLSIQTPYHVILFIYIIRSFGMSLLMMPIMTAGMNALPQHLISHGTAMSNTVRQVAGSIGTAFLVTIMTSQTKIHVATYGNELSQSNPLLMDKLHDLSAALGGTQLSELLSSSVLMGQISKLSTINGINDAFLIATVFSGIALFLALFLKKTKPIETIEQKEEVKLLEKEETKLLETTDQNA